MSSRPRRPSIAVPDSHYNHDQMPPDWELAEKHARSVQPGKHIHNKNQACPCCLNYIQKQPVSFSQDNKELAFLGEGFPLFYNFLKFCMIMLMALIADSSVLGIYLGTQENQCAEYSPTDDSHYQDNSTSTHRLLSTTKCSYSVATKYAYIDTSIQPDYRRIIKIMAFCVQVMLLLYFRERQGKLASYIDQRNCTMSDYTIFIDKLPRNTGDIKYRLTRLIEGGPSRNLPAVDSNLLNSEEDEGIQVMEVLAVGDSKEYYQMEKQLKQIIKNKKQAIKLLQNEEALKQIDALYDQKNKEIEFLSKRMKSEEKKYFIGCAFVVLNTQRQKENAIQKLSSLSTEEIKKWFPDYNPEVNGQLEVSEANQPRQIIWQNIHVTFSERMIALAGGWVLTLGLLAAVTIGFFFLIRYKSQLVEEAIEKYKYDPVKYKSEWEGGSALSFIIIILINFFNKYVFSWISHAITDLEKHISSSEYQQSFAMKYMLGMFFTTALMTLAVEAIVYNNYSHSFGVVEEETFMFVFNAFFPPFAMLFDPSYLIKVIRRKMAWGAQHYTQFEANHIMEEPQYNMGKRYAEIMKTMWFTFLYCELIPAGPVFSLCGILVYYCIDKWVLLRRSTVDSSISSKLSRRMISVLEFTLVLKPAGDLLFNSQLRGGRNVEDFIMLGLGILYLLLPLDYLLNFFFEEKFDPEQKKYEEVKDKFTESYLTLYPLHKYEQSQFLSKRSISFASQKSLQFMGTSKNLLKGFQNHNKIHAEDGDASKHIFSVRDLHENKKDLAYDDDESPSKLKRGKKINQPNPHQLTNAKLDEAPEEDERNSIQLNILPPPQEQASKQTTN